MHNGAGGWQNFVRRRLFNGGFYVCFVKNFLIKIENDIKIGNYILFSVLQKPFQHVIR